jgi:hypothetical protein
VPQHGAAVDLQKIPREGGGEDRYELTLKQSDGSLRKLQADSIVFTTVSY